MISVSFQPSEPALNLTLLVKMAVDFILMQKMCIHPKKFHRGKRSGRTFNACIALKMKCQDHAHT